MLHRSDLQATAAASASTDAAGTASDLAALQAQHAALNAAHQTLTSELSASRSAQDRLVAEHEGLTRDGGALQVRLCFLSETCVCSVWSFFTL